ncbi:MAG: putative Long-chain-fatty-acid--CoA ligase [Promethearchaeota archaeon]|nr:MAG: putative Long-chain-fatty-acid--CoA ligase [Candidatus Lokiarchaeota archaeon]
MNKKVKAYWNKSWPEETPKSIDYDELSMGKLLERTAKKYPNSEAIYFEGWECSYEELNDLVDKFATGLSELGIKKGDVVAIDLPNVPQYVIAHFAVLKLGAISNPILPVNRYVEITHQIRNSNAKMLIILDHLYEEYLHEKDLSKMESLETVILTELSDYLPKFKGFLGKVFNKIPYMKEWPNKVGKIHFRAFKKVLKKRNKRNVPKVKINIREDPAVLIYTGGTTGVPKGVVTTHYNLIVNAQQANMWADTQLVEMKETKGKGGMLLVVPLAHSYGNIGMSVAILEGWKLVLLPRPPEPISDILKTCAKHKITYLPGVPTLYHKLNEDPASKKYKGKLDSLLACICAASPLSKEVKDNFENITDASIVEGYGMSECSPIISLNPFKNTKIKTVGLPLPDTEIKVVDFEDRLKMLPACPRETCKDCGISTEQKYVGEICVSGPQVMKGYLNNPEATEYALETDSEGKKWLFTTDVGCIRARDGYLRLKDRKRDMIKYKGHSVFPREVEALMLMHEAIEEVGVIGVPHEDAGENIKAYITLKQGYDGYITAEDIKEWCKENISAYKYPRLVEIAPELPKNVIGKILKRELRQMT